MKQRAWSLGLFVSTLTALGTLGVACSSSSGPREGFTTEQQDAAQSGSFIEDGGTGVDGEAGPNKCLSEALAAEPVPLAMLLVMDRSGSMVAPNENSKWDQARSAMIGFSDATGVIGTELGLIVFPPDPNSGLDQCKPGSYAPIVPIAPLPGNAVEIKAALAIREANGSTPMSNALFGAIAAMKAHLATKPSEDGILMLVTDGDPTGCTGDTVPNIASIVEKAANDKPSIRTFVIGMDGATFTNLDIIAAAGKGTPTAFNTEAKDGGVSAQQQMVDALNTIRTTALGCQYLVPVPDPSKGTVDPDSVSIDFTPGQNDPKQNIRRVPDAASCGETTGGFYYDDPQNPTRIVLCPATCKDVRGGSTVSKLDVVLGCIKPPT